MLESVDAASLRDYINKLKEHGDRFKGYGNKFRTYHGQVKEWWLTEIWNGWVRPIASLLMLVRFSVLVAILCGYILLINDQGQEVIRSLAETKGLRHTICFVFSAFICAVVAWYWARVAFFFSFNGYQSDPKQHSGIREHLPRIIGAAVFFVIAVALIKASLAYDDLFKGPSGQLKLLATVFLALGLGFPYFARWLRKWFRLRDEDRPDDPDFIVHLPKKTWPFLLLGLVTTISLTMTFAYGAVKIAPLLGAGAIILLFAAALIGNGTFLVLYFGTRRALPVIGLLLVWAIVLSLFVDNHHVRQHRDMRSYEDFRQAAGMPKSFKDVTSIADYFNEWISELETAHQGPEPIPVFVVAAEGGGIRAAYWTAIVLGELQDRARLHDIDFARHVFAISGVSGGSLGAATFAALLASQANGEQPTTSNGCGNGHPGSIQSIRYRSHRILAKDFLSPAVAVMLFPDFFQRFFPLSALDDRAIALERSWEEAWRDCEKGDRFARPFESLWQEGDFKRVPLLFLNSTVVDSGQRLIATPIPLAREKFENAFSDALATTRVLGHEIPLSTAVHTSARFTYVSPAGTVRRLDVDGSTERQRWIRVVDGGYFENSGAVTANEILTEVERAAWGRWTAQKANGNSPRPIRPIVIHISNDPIQEPQVQWTRQSSKGAFLAEILSPVEALLNVRPARGYQARTALAYRLQGIGQQTREANKKEGPIDRPGMHFHFRLCEYDVPLPLGWMLSEETQGEMQAQLSDDLARQLDREKRGIAHYHQNLIERIMGVLDSKADISQTDQLQVKTHKDCMNPRAAATMP